MEASFVCSKVTPFRSPLFLNTHSTPFRPFNKQFELKIHSSKNWVTRKNFNPNGCSLHSGLSSSSLYQARTVRPPYPFKCAYSSSMASNDSPNSSNPILISLKSLSLESLKSSLLQLTPVTICKWALLLSVAIVASKWSLGLLSSPFFWMYFSWSWCFWPWMVATSLGFYGLHSLKKHLNGEASLFEQLSIITSSFTWLTLVPPAHFNGFLEGWPFVFFFVYHYFFFLNVSVRKRLYGDYYPRENDNKWSVSLPNWQKLLFCIGVMVGHWLAAFEGTELHLIPGGWNNVGIWGLIVLTVFIQYHSTLYLAKYSEKVVVPTAVVQFGPFRFVRHPIYASTMLLFVTYFAALRAPMSSLFMVAVCLMYYGQKAKLEEELMLETFEESYREYMNKVRYKLIPFVY